MSQPLILLESSQSVSSFLGQWCTNEKTEEEVRASPIGKRPITFREKLRYDSRLVDEQLARGAAIQRFATFVSSPSRIFQDTSSYALSDRSSLRSPPLAENFANSILRLDFTGDRRRRSLCFPYAHRCQDNGCPGISLSYEFVMMRFSSIR